PDTLACRQSIGWFTLNQPMSYYVDPTGGSGGLANLFNDCTTAAGNAVNFASFHGINMVFNGPVFQTAWGGTEYGTVQGVTKAWPTAWYWTDGTPQAYGE